MSTVPAIQSQQSLDVQALISQALDKGTDPETLERLMALGERMMAVRAKQAYDGAMAAFHRDCPPIYKTAAGQVGNAKTRYAPLDEIMDKARPVLGANGLSASWRSPRTEAGKVVRVCRISHALGHFEESGEIVIPVGAAGAATPAQQVGLAIAYADRYSVKDILGLAPEPGEDTDGKAPGNGPEEPAGQQDEPGQVTTINESQIRMLWAVAGKSGWGDKQETETAVHDILAARKIEHVKDVPADKFNALLNLLKAGPQPK